MAWVKVKALKKDGYQGPCNLEDLPVKEGHSVRIRKGTSLRTTNPKRRHYTAGRTYVVNVNHLLSGMRTRDDAPDVNPKVCWAGQHGWWTEADINDVEIWMSVDNLPRPVYPGHGMMVALYAMILYEGAKEALKPTSCNPYSILGNSMIPGSGDGAYAGVDVIGKVAKGEMSVIEALEWADENWKHRVGPGSGNQEDRYEDGQKQAQEMREVFLYVASHWDWEL